MRLAMDDGREEVVVVLMMTLDGLFAETRKDEVVVPIMFGDDETFVAEEEV